MTVTNEQISEILISAVLFIVLWQVMRLLVFRPFFSNFEAREARTTGDEALAIEKRQQAKRRAAELEEQLRAARLEGIRDRDEQVARAKQEAQLLLDRANADAAEEFRRAASNVAELKKKAYAEVPQEVDKLAKLVVSRALTTDSSSTVH